MDSASAKISDLQMSQYRSIKKIENLDFHIAELKAETETESSELRDKREKLKELKSENSELKANMQKLRKFIIFILIIYWQTVYEKKFIAMNNC